MEDEATADQDVTRGNIENMNISSFFPTEDVPSNSRYITFFWDRHHYQNNFFLDLFWFLLPAYMGPRVDFLDFSVIYLSFLHGWLFYVHHFSGRLLVNDHSKWQFFFWWMLVFSFGSGVWALSYLNDENELSLRVYQRCSLAFGMNRLAIVCLFSHTGLHLRSLLDHHSRSVQHIITLCWVVVFFVCNSCLSFFLASVAENEFSLRLLWMIALLVELQLEAILSLCVREAHRVEMKKTMDRWLLILLGPIGSLALLSVTTNPTNENGISLGSQDKRNICLFTGLLVLVAILFCQLKLNVALRLSRHGHAFVQALGICHLKLLGLAVWATTRPFIEMSSQKSLSCSRDVQSDANCATGIAVAMQYQNTSLLGVQILGIISLLFVWKSYANTNPYHVSYVFWILAINVSLGIGTIWREKQGQILLLNIALLLLLNISEYCLVMSSTEQESQSERDRSINRHWAVQYWHRLINSLSTSWLLNTVDDREHWYSIPNTSLHSTYDDEHSSMLENNGGTLGHDSAFPSRRSYGNE